ncbi:MAG: transposase [Chloroflexota bacterium]
MKEKLLEAAGIEEEAIASDSTGFSPGQASLYYQTRSGKRYQRWCKGVYAVGVASLYILAWRFGYGPSSDAPYLSGLRRDARRYGKRRAWVMLADAGFDGKTVQEGDLIPPVRRHGKLTDADRKARAELVDQTRLDGLFGQRWKSESVISVIKRKFGDAIRSRKTSLQNREPIVKGLVYNIHL